MARILLALFLMLFVMSTVQITNSRQGACRRAYILAAAKGGVNSTMLHLSTVSPSTINFTLEIPGHILPTLECGRDYVLCDILLIEREKELLVFLPSQGGFVKVTYIYSQGFPQHSFHPVNKDCHLINSFYNDEQNRVFMECLNLSPETNENLYIIAFRLTDSQLSYSDRSHTIQSAAVLSPAVYASETIFQVENQNLYYTEAKIAEIDRALVAFQMAGCSHVNQMDTIGEDTLYMYCNNQVTWSATTHAKQPDLPQSMYNYPCVDYDSMDIIRLLHVQDGKLTFEKPGGSNVTVTLPSDDIVFGICHGSKNIGTFAFWGLTGDGLLFAVDLASNGHNITHLFQCAENQTCLKPAIDKNRTVGGYFDPDGNIFHVQNLTGFCGHTSVVLPFSPDMLRVFTSVKLYEDQCVCPDRPLTEPPTDPTTGATSTTDSVGTESATNTVTVTVGVTVGGFALLLLFVIIILIAIWWRHPNRCPCGSKCDCHKKITAAVGVSSQDGTCHYVLGDQKPLADGTIELEQLVGCVNYNMRDNSRRQVANIVLNSE